MLRGHKVCGRTDGDDHCWLKRRAFQDRAGLRQIRPVGEDDAANQVRPVGYDGAAMIASDSLGDVARPWESTDNPRLGQSRQRRLDFGRRRQEAALVETANRAAVIDAAKFNTKTRIVRFLGTAE